MYKYKRIMDIVMDIEGKVSNEEMEMEMGLEMDEREGEHCIMYLHVS